VNGEVGRPAGTLQAAGATRSGQSGPHLVERGLGVLPAEPRIGCLRRRGVRCENHRTRQRNARRELPGHVRLSPALVDSLPRRLASRKGATNAGSLGAGRRVDATLATALKQALESLPASAMTAGGRTKHHQSDQPKILNA
jgi:hypothetical protein